MTVRDTGENLGRLHERAREFASAITESNHLPDGFPREGMCLVAQALCELNDADRPEDRQVLVHAQAKLRETRRVFRGTADEETSFFELERSHHALFAEIDEVLEHVPAEQLVPLQPATDGPPLIVRRADIEAMVAAEVQRLQEALRAAGPEATVNIQNYIDQSRHFHVDVTLLRIGRDLRVTLEGLVKVAWSFSAELAGHLINLPWVRQLTGRVAALTAALRKGIDALKRATDDLPELVQAIEQVRRLAERAVRGAITLFKMIRRMLRRRGNERPPRPGTVFRDVDAPWCPELVVIPAGRFLMGSPEDEEHRDHDEGPRHEVVIGAPFALGRYPVTFDEFDAFCESAGRERPDDEGWGRGRRPVVNVSWEDARAYAAWLREQTGQRYRLASEAEWEYACRAGTTTPFWTGSTISTAQANYNGGSAYWGGSEGEYRQQTTPVDVFPANPWKLHDMHGNVWEWVEDRGHDSYEGAPTDGSARLEGTSSARVFRGGGWDGSPWFLRSAKRGGSVPGAQLSNLGFRISRALTP